MDIRARRDHIYNYILSHFSEEQFRSLKAHDTEEIVTEIDRYEDFIENQRDVVDAMDEANVDFMYRFVLLIPNIDTMDEEVMFPSRLSGFIFATGKFVLQHA